MTEKKLKEQLHSLQAITPDEDFTRTSRLLVLSSREPKSRIALTQTLSFGASVALVSVFIFVLTLGGVGGTLKSFLLPSLPGVDNDSVVAEADTITNDIDIKLSEIEYFTNDTVALAGGETSEKSPASGHAADETEIDALLDEVIEY